MQLSLVSKEVLITGGIFLLTFLLGAHLLDSLNFGAGDAVTTAAVAANTFDTLHYDSSQSAVQGATIQKGKRGVFGLFSDEDKDDKKGLRELEKKRKNNLITGNVIGVAAVVAKEGVFAAEEGILQHTPLQNTYAIKPDFVIPQPVNVSFSEFSDAFYRQRTLFSQQVKNCLAEHPKGFLSLCIQQTLQKDEFKHWLQEDKCETSQEQVFYDFVEHLHHCFTEQNCLCQFSMKYERGYGAASYGFILSSSPTGLQVQMPDSKLTVIFPAIFFTSSLTPTEHAQPFFYNVRYANQEITGAYFGLQQSASTSIFDLFSSAEPSLVSDEHLYLLKDGNAVTFLTAADFAEREDYVSPCEVPGKYIYKFCYPVADALHVFAMDFTGFID